MWILIGPTSFVLRKQVLALECKVVHRLEARDFRRGVPTAAPGGRPRGSAPNALGAHGPRANTVGEAPKRKSGPTPSLRPQQGRKALPLSSRKPLPDQNTSWRRTDAASPSKAAEPTLPVPVWR